MSLLPFLRRKQPEAAPAAASVAPFLAGWSIEVMPRTAERPRPRPVNLVVKKGSNIRAAIDGSMPAPVSETST